MRNRLTDMHIDEVSLVDRPANQNAHVAIAKRDSGDNMPDFVDADGYPVDESDIQPGDFLYDPETGEEFFMAGDDHLAALQELQDDGYDDPFDAFRQGDSFGKADWAGIADNAQKVAGNAGRSARDAGRRGKDWARKQPLRGAMRSRSFISRHPIGTVAAAAAGGAGADRVSKSLGDIVYSELSKAYDADGRNEVISKVAGLLDEQREEIAYLRETLEEQIAKSESADFAAEVDAYGLPIDSDVLGGVLRRASYALAPEDLEVLGEVLGVAGTFGKAFEELGTEGGYQSGSTYGEIESYADSMIAKANGQFSKAQAVTAIFEENPDAYDQYLAEQARGY